MSVTVRAYSVAIRHLEALSVLIPSVFILTLGHVDSGTLSGTLGEVSTGTCSDLLEE